jgi:hypothetical protein
LLDGDLNFQRLAVSDDFGVYFVTDFEFGQAVSNIDGGADGYSVEFFASGGGLSASAHGRSASSHAIDAPEHDYSTFVAELPASVAEATASEPRLSALGDGFAEAEQRLEAPSGIWTTACKPMQRLASALTAAGLCLVRPVVQNSLDGRAAT